MGHRLSAEYLVFCIIHVGGDITAVGTLEAMGSNPAFRWNFYIFLVTRKPCLLKNLSNSFGFFSKST